MAKKPKKLSGKQKAFVALWPGVETGRMTLEQALKKAGYSDSTAKQQSRVVDSVRKSSEMQKALREAGVTEIRIAKKIGRGMEAMGPVGLGYTKLAAELIDAFPAKKIEDVTPPKTYGEIEDRPKPKTLTEAKEMAEEAGFEDDR